MPAGVNARNFAAEFEQKNAISTESAQRKSPSRQESASQRRISQTIHALTARHASDQKCTLQLVLSRELLEDSNALLDPFECLWLHGTSILLDHSIEPADL